VNLVTTEPEVAPATEPGATAPAAATGAPTTAAGTVLKVISNVSEPSVFIDGQMVGKAPLGVDVTPGEHLLEVKREGYQDARLTFRISEGEQKFMSADLVKNKAAPALMTPRRATSSFSAVTVDPRHFTADLLVGYVPFGQFRLTTGALRTQRVGLD